MRISKLDDKVIDNADAITNTIKEKPEIPEASTQRDYLPPHNEKADTREQLYPMEGLISADVMEGIDISRPMACFKKPKLIKRLKDNWDLFTVKTLSKINEDEEEKIKAVTYLNGLIRIFKLPNVVKFRR